MLRVERDLGPFKLPPPKADYPVDYVLDGQQRLTSIFGVFQTELKMENNIEWSDIYFDLQADNSAQDTQFVALREDAVDLLRHFPLKTLFDTTAYRKATRTFDDETAKKIDEVQSIFKETRIPIQMSNTEDKATVAIIFERVNRQGVELDTLQLLSAWTWSEEFQLQEQFSDLAEQLAPFGFAAVGGDTDLLLRCCSAILTDDASPEALMSLNGSIVRRDFDKVMNGVKYSVDYVRQNFHVETLSNLPFTTLLVPLSVFFGVEGNKEAKYNDFQRSQINRWFWRSVFSRRYSSGVLRSLKADISEMRKLRDGKASSLGDFSVSISDDFFTGNKFGMGNVNTKSFILMLAHRKPLSFVSGAEIDLARTLKESNRVEFHHLMPRQFLQETGQNSPDESALANFCFLSRADNRQLGGVSPTKYRSKMPTDVGAILERAICPQSLFSDNFSTFTAERASMLTAAARLLCEL